MEPANLLFDNVLSDASVLCIVHDGTNYDDEISKHHQRAIDVQDMYQANDKDIIVIVTHGDRISVRYPNSDQWEEWDPAGGVTVSKIIQDIDDDHEWGLDTPVFVFCPEPSRGMPLRSQQRVPTQLVVLPRCGLSVEPYVHALNRATYSQGLSTGFSGATGRAMGHNRNLTHIYVLPGNATTEEEETFANEAVQAEANAIVSTMTPTLLDLVQICGTLEYQRLTENLVDALETNHPVPRIGITVTTQSQKQAIKGLVQAVCLKKKCPVFVMTRDILESNELCSKLKALAGPIGSSRVVPVSSGVEDVVGLGGTVVVRDTKSQIRQAINALHSSHGKFVVIVDDCDMSDNIMEFIRQASEIGEGMDSRRCGLTKELN